MLSQKSALGLRCSLLVFPLALLGPIFIDRLKLGGTISQWALATVVAYLVMIVLMTIGQLALTRVVATRARVIGTLGVLILAIAIRGYVMGLMTIYFGFASELMLWYRTGMGELFFLPLFIGAASIIVIWDYNSSLISDLESKRQQLLTLQTSMQEQVVRIGQDMVAYVRSRMMPKIAKIDNTLRNIDLQNERNGASHQLREMIENDVRPLTYELLEESSELIVPLLSAKQTSRSYRLPRYFNLASAVRVQWMSILILLGLLISSSRELKLAQSVVFVGYSTVLVPLLLSALKRMLTHRNIQLLLGSVFFVLTVGFVGVIAQESAPLFGIPSPLFTKGGVFLFGCAVGFGNVIYSLLADRRQSLIQSLDEIVTELAKNVGVLRQHTWVLRRRLTYAMHGPLQSALYAASLRLGDHHPISKEELDKMRTDIETAFIHCELTEATTIPFQQSLQDLVDVWDGVVDISAEISQQAQLILESSIVTASCISEVIGEAVSNAAKHGDAKHINIHLSTNSDGLLLKVSDDGAGLSTTTAGLGKRLFSEVCTHWKLANSQNGGVVLEAAFAVADGVV